MDNSFPPSAADVVHASTLTDQQSHEGSSNKHHSDPVHHPHQPAHSSQNKSRQICRFFRSKAGCRAGEHCRYRHELPSQKISAGLDSSVPLTKDAGDTEKSLTSSSAHTHDPSPQARIVSKPISAREREDPREYQISQIVRRYSPFRADLEESTSLKFSLTPTDPDFPFELETGLHCVLSVPLDYPQNGRPSLSVQNPEMAKGFQINVEKGFDSLVSNNTNKSLLAILNELDKNLERFLTASKAVTVKLVANTGKVEPTIEAPDTAKASDYTPVPPVFQRYNSTRLSAAKIRRDAEIRRLQARLGRSEVFSKAGDGVAFNIPLNIQNVSAIPASLRSVRETALIVPEVYPLEPPTVILKGVESRDAELVEIAFEKWAVQNNALTLMAHINYLTQNIAKMAVDPTPQTVTPVTDDKENSTTPDPQTMTKVHDRAGEIRDPLRPHLQYIARPPEWDIRNDHDIESETDTDTDTSESDEDLESDNESALGGVEVPINTNAGPEKGIMISFPNLELTGIGILQLTNLSLSVKCDRCKEQLDIKNIKPSDHSATIHRSEPCSKCTSSLSITYRAEPMHQNSTKAGYIDIENCTIVDLLPSTFQPTCLDCSTPFPSPPGVTAVRGDTPPLTLCRTCHAKMTFALPDVKFLRVSTSTPHTNPLPLRPKKPKENLGITSGAPLLNNGRCAHYAKSYRWFRFSCCGRVFPCDKCHDVAVAAAGKDSAHPTEHAERMICGWCSREQRYHPDSCRMCGRSVVRKVVTTGFWEGGRGTREKGLMSRKEGRKYKTSGKEKKEKAARKKTEPEARAVRMWWPE